jgi:hypothetical protein
VHICQNQNYWKAATSCRPYYPRPKRANPDDTRIGPDQRSDEYDSVTPDFGHFLISEALPYIENELGITFTVDSTRRSVCGNSSDDHNFPYLIRSTQRKDVRAYLHSGEQDESILLGD